MTDFTNPYLDSSESPEPPPAKRSRVGRLPKAALTGGVILGLALGGTGIGFAVASATSSTSPTTNASGSTPTTTPSGASHGFRGGRMGGPGFPSFGPLAGGGVLGGGVVHGEFTVRSGSGYKTEEIQVGTVSAVTSSSITVASADGYTHTYAVSSTTEVNSQAGGIASVTKNDNVSVTATPVKGTDTAASIVDTTKLQGSRSAFGFGGGFRGAPGGSTPASPSAPSGATTAA